MLKNSRNPDQTITKSLLELFIFSQLNQVQQALLKNLLLNQIRHNHFMLDAVYIRKFAKLNPVKR